MAAALVELRVSGYDGLTVRNVARRAEVAPATAYSYFGSKDHLVAEVFWRRFQAESDRITDTFASATSSWDSAVASQRSSLENLKLPKKPEV